MGLRIWRKTNPSGNFLTEDGRGLIRFKVKEAFISKEGNCIIASPRTVTTFFKTEKGWEEDFFGLKHIVEGIEQEVLFEREDVSFVKVVVDEESIKALQEIYKTTRFSVDFDRPTVEFVANS